MVTIMRQNFSKNAKLYRCIEAQLRKILGDVPITHVGSTAIPNMSGKNIY
jgi:GrpB-like predicted nucleotidyltransferase (UPF0157 family)